VAEVPDSYASPWLRWSLLLTDHPDAKQEFTLQHGTDTGVPADFGGDDQLCVATVTVPGQGRFLGYKEIPRSARDRDPDTWNLLCAKALGRALKRAGYPSDLQDLKALMLWRRRNEEIRVLGHGMAVTEMPSAAVEELQVGKVQPDEYDAEEPVAPRSGPTAKPADPSNRGEVTPEPVADGGEPPLPRPARQSANPPAAAQAAPRTEGDKESRGAPWCYLPDDLQKRVQALPTREQMQVVDYLDRRGLSTKSPSKGQLRAIAGLVDAAEATAKAPARDLGSPKPAPEPAGDGMASDDVVNELLARYDALSAEASESVLAAMAINEVSWTVPMRQEDADLIAELMSPAPAMA